MIRSRFWNGLRVQLRILGALMVRDALRRYGHHNLGFFWVVGEPLMLTCGVMFVWSVTGMAHHAGMSVVPFALTGYTFLTVWRHTSFRAVRVMRNNANLAYHRQISPIDTILAMGMMESVAVFAAFMVAYVPLWLLGACPPIRDPLILIGGYLLVSWFALSFALVVAGLSELSEVLEHLLQPLLYLTLPITGAFTMVEWLPAKYQSVMLWSPLVNGIEMFRGGLFPPDYPTSWNAVYLTSWCVALTAIGLPLCRHAQKSLETTG